MTHFAALIATWSLFFVAVPLFFEFSHRQGEAPPRWLRPACLTALAILFAASMVVIWSGVKP